MEESSPYEKARYVRQSYRDMLLSKPHVVGLGIGFRKVGGQMTDEVALIVMVDKKLPEYQLKPGDQIPRELDGVPVDVQEIGQIRAL
jgi:hypothetical protein